MAAASPVWSLFHLGCYRSAVSLSALNDVPLIRQLPWWCVDQTPALVPPPAEGRSSPNTPVFPCNSFILPSFVWVYIFFSAGQVLLSTLIWCSACTSVSEGVFLIHHWREMYSTSTYSSAILFSDSKIVVLNGKKKKQLSFRVKKVDFYSGGKLLLEEYADLEVRVEEPVLRRFTSTVSIWKENKN